MVRLLIGWALISCVAGLFWIVGMWLIHDLYGDDDE